MPLLVLVMRVVPQVKGHLWLKIAKTSTTLGMQDAAAVVAIAINLTMGPAPGYTGSVGVPIS